MAVAILQQWVVVGISWGNDGYVMGMWCTWAVLLTRDWVEAIILIPVIHPSANVKKVTQWSSQRLSIDCNAVQMADPRCVSL